MNYQIIDQVELLNQVCQQAREASVVMLDTEFVRIRSYYPKLGLIQLFDGKSLSLIDPCVFKLNNSNPAQSEMKAFIELLQDNSVLKVLHACGEDLEVFNNAFGCLPSPIVDTQIMAAFLGNGLSTGFAALVKEFIGVELDKSESRTDWLARPLSIKQLEYAAADVHYLMPLYQQLLEKVQAAGWWEHALQESQRLVNKRIKTVDENKLYCEIKGAWQLNPAQLAILKPLAIWRYKEAVRRDLALNFVFKEQDLWTVAQLGLSSLSSMERAGIDIRSIHRYGRKIATIVATAQQLPAEQYPKSIERLVDHPNYKVQFKILKDEVQKVASSSGLAAEFLASNKQLQQLIRWVWLYGRSEDKYPDLMVGWRRDMLGLQLDKLVMPIRIMEGNE